MLRVCAAVLGLVSLFPVRAVAGEFEWMVRQFARESGARPTHIPFFGLARFVVNVGQPAGTSDLKLAIFEKCACDGARFRNFADASMGNNWTPMIRVRSRNGESTNIYQRREGRRLGLMIATAQGSEATFVEVRLEPDRLLRFVDEHGGWRHRGD